MCIIQEKLKRKKIWLRKKKWPVIDIADLTDTEVTLQEFNDSLVQVYKMSDQYTGLIVEFSPANRRYFTFKRNLK
jgi:hypothetical protein